MMKHSLLFVLVSWAFTGCSSPVVLESNAADTLVDQRILDAARKIETAQLHLYRSAALSERVKRPDTLGPSSAERVTISWKGDASQLLSRLASDRGFKFAAMGVRMPLPVAIDVRDEPLPAVLDHIRLQVGYRAVVEQKVNMLVLHYNRPQY